MKVRKKNRGQTEMEKRNTAITIFILFAITPLFLTMFLGFSLKQSEAVNKDKLFKNLESQRKKYDDLNQNIANLDSVFLQANKLFKQFKDEEAKNLKRELGDIEDKTDLNEWDKDREEKVNNYIRKINKVENSFDFGNSVEKNNLLILAKEWLKEFIEAKDNELYAKQLIKEQSLEIQDGSDLEILEQDLRMEIVELKNELKSKEKELELYKDFNEKNESKMISKYSSLLAVNEKTKTAISVEIKDIEDKILPELQRKLFNNEFDKLKNKLKNKISTIKIEAGNIKTEE